MLAHAAAAPPRTLPADVAARVLACGVARAQLHGGRIEQQAVRDMSGAVPETVITKLFAVCKRNHFDEMQSLVEEILADGFPAEQVACLAVPHAWPCLS